TSASAQGDMSQEGLASHRFWLPHNVTWADLKNTDEATFPQAEDLYLACPLAFCIFMIRLVFERFIARPCAMGLKIQANGPQKAQPNAILEKVFTAITKHPDEKRLEGLSKQLDWDVRTIQRWFRQRRNQEKPSTLARFCESMSVGAYLQCSMNWPSFYQKAIDRLVVTKERQPRMHTHTLKPVGSLEQPNNPK
uniref:Ceramide synthase 6 n=1 Tax=Poecilia latipinna TaxID=48699 RepID=A0A3B3VL49_9TELE